MEFLIMEIQITSHNLVWKYFPAIFAQTNVIEASPDMHMESEKEWYFGNAEKERLGPYSYEEVSIILSYNATDCT